MKRITTLVVLIGALAVVTVACTSDPEPTIEPTSVPTTIAPPAVTAGPEIVPENAEVDRKEAMLIGIDLHRQLWATRPSSNYKYGFQWTVGEFAYQRANVEVRVIKGVVDDVLWADNAIKTDGTEPEGFVVPDKPNMDEYYSIEGLFEVISEAIGSDPGKVTLGFDSIFGFPTVITIEFAPDNPHKDVSFFAAQLVPIPGPPE